jgi:hypothetical protein
MTTISAAIIARSDGGGSLQRAVASIRPFVDEVCLTWTCKEGEERPHIEGVDSVHFFDGCNAQVDCPPESTCQCKAGQMVDFGAARSASFSVTSCDLTTYVDSDDVVVQACPGSDLRDLYTEKERTVFPYEYGYDKSGNCVSHQYTDRVVPKATRWTDPIHNMLIFQPGMRLRTCRDFTWKHQRTVGGEKDSSARALRIVRHWQREAKYANDARFVYHLGRIHLDCGLRGRASVELERAFGLTTHVDMKTMVALDLARCHPPAYGVMWGHRALELRPEWPAPWLCLARLYHTLSVKGVSPRKNDRLARQFLKVGLACEEPETLIILDPTDKARTSRLVLGMTQPVTELEARQD